MPQVGQKIQILQKFGFQDSVHAQYLKNFLFKMAKCRY